MRKLILTCSLLAAICLAACGGEAAVSGGPDAAAESAPPASPAASLSVTDETEPPAQETDPAGAAEASEPPEKARFSDVQDSDPFAEALDWADQAGLSVGRSDTVFGAEDPMTRGQIADWLWRVNGQKTPLEQEPPFDDVSADDDIYTAVLWGVEKKIFSVPENRTFAPDSPCSHAQVLTFLWRSKGYASSNKPWYGAACAWAERYGILEDGAAPEWRQPCTRADAVCYLYRYHMMDDSYDYTQPVPESASVSPDWFDDAFFIGDSVTVRLNVYCAATGALSNAHFLAEANWCAGNVYVEDDITMYQPKKVYIMLGINDMAYDFERVIQNMVTLVDRILERAPDASILIESVTPMTETSGRADEHLNNTVIREYNARMLELCAENGWYYVDVAYPCSDADGYLKPELCGDATGMGIHFSTEGAEVWVDYLMTHVPEPLK